MMPSTLARLVPISALLLFTAACGGAPAKPPADAGVEDPVPDAGNDLPDAGPAIASIEVRPDPELICLDGCLTFEGGQTRAFVATAKDADGNDLPEVTAFSWSSTNEALATVSSDGMVTAKKAGDTSIVATARGISGEAVIHIKPSRVASIVVTPNPLTVASGASAALTAKGYDEHGAELDDVTFTWTSANPQVATVDGNGWVTGVRGGRAVVFASSDRAFGAGWASVEVTSSTPRPAGLALTGISVGSHHGCGVDSAGTAYCWGWNFFGQLGVNRLDAATDSFPVPEKVVTGESFASVELGAVHSCALAASGEAWCWGSNESGQLGTHAMLREVGGTTVPYKVLGGLAFDQLSGGEQHTCGLTVSDHLAYCWGMGQDGALGLGDYTARPTPTPVDTTLSFTRIAAGLQSTCALAADGKAYCWGRNGMGVLGTAEAPSELIQHDLPTAVSGGMSFQELALTASHACALDSLGAAWCWGNDTYGQLGNGNTTSMPLPQQVATPERFVTIAVGAHHSCALQADGDVFCWGNNGSGQLGDGTLQDSTTPVQVVGGETFATLTAGANVTCGLTTGGEALCWGSGDLGESGGGASGGLFVAPWPVVIPAN